MYVLVYLSSTPELLTETELVDILQKSRINNEKLEITGLLLYNEGNIIQVLEGDKSAVRNLYDHICRDVRHSNQMVMFESNSTVRNFPNWSMGFKQVSKEDWLPFKGYFNLRKEEVLTKFDAHDLSILTVINSYMNVNVRS